MVGTKLLPEYRQATKNVLDSQHVTLDAGLSNNEANERLTLYGPNVFKQQLHDSHLLTYLKQFKDLMILLLLGSCIVVFYIGDRQTGFALLGLVLLNTLIGFFQEFKAERIMENLELLVVPTAKVKRNNIIIEVSSTELVPGDIIYIEEGDSVPADARLVEESELATNDFALTGESNPSRKFTHAISEDVPLGNRHNLIFMGTTVATGHGYAVVTATGMQTELGRIAGLSQSTIAQASPLQREINHTATLVTKATLGVGVVIVLVALQAEMELKLALLYAVGVASSLIPQGLPAEINTSLAQAAGKLAKMKALIKKLSAVETLGATSIICTDKTGTLTKNQMTVEQLLVGKNTYSISGTGYEANGTIQQNNQALSKQQLKDLELFFLCGAFASNARIDPPDDEHPNWYCVGDPTEGALITLANKAGINVSDLDKTYPELREFAFDSGRKRMSSIRAWGDGSKLYVFAKGAPEKILERCDDFWDHGHTRKLTDKDRQSIITYNTAQADNAMRNLGFAYAVLPSKTDLKKLDHDMVEQHLTWLGIASMVDPLREEVAAAMGAAHRAHIKVSIITGDYAPTALAVARKASLAENKQKITVVSGNELKTMPDEHVVTLVETGAVIFSRVSPEDKLRIVELVKDSGHIIAVTGDGINDAPALKRADIGVAMGKTGTEVSKQSADIILLDDSFHTLVGAVQQGRIIYQNIKKGALSCFTTNSAELVINITSLLAFSFFNIPLALTVMEILAIDLIAELFPIAALGWDKADGELMQDAPRNPSKHILNKKSILDLAWCGLIIGALAYGNYLLFFSRAGVEPQGLTTGLPIHAKATAITYLTIVLCQLVNILQRRSRGGFFTRYQLHNRYLWFAMLLSITCVSLIMYSPINTYFGAGPLGVVDWLAAFTAASIFLCIREAQRILSSRFAVKP